MKITTKRKMYQKRRKKEKAEQRKKDLQGKQQTGSKTATSYKYNSNNHNTNKTNQRNFPTIKNNHHHQPSTNHHSVSPITSYSQSIQLWWQTYCSAIEFHTRQQNAWQDDDGEDQQLMLLQQYANEYETSSEEEEDPVQPHSNKTNLDNENTNDKSAEDDVDEEYLKFLEITHKHRKELLLKRAEGNV